VANGAEIAGKTYDDNDKNRPGRSKLRQRRLWLQDIFVAKICCFFHFIEEK